MAKKKKRIAAMAQDPFSTLLFRIGVLGSSLGLVSSLYFLAGLAGYIRSPVLNIAAAASVILAALYFIYLFFVRLRDKSRLGSFIWFSILVILIVEVFLGLVPPTARDELTQHLAMPRLYINAGQISEIPFDPHSYFPMLIDMLFTPFVQWGWDSIPKLIHGLFGFLTALLLYGYLGRRLSPIYGLLGFFFFISTPAILRLSNLAYVDLGLIFYSTASLLCLLHWLEDTEARRWLVLAGFLAGFALATKPNGLLVFLLFFFLLAFALGRDPVRGIGQTAFGLLSLCILALFPFSPWLLKNMIQTGNPLFPLFTGLFGGAVEGGGEAGLGILTKRALLYGESWWEIAAVPLRLFFFAQDDRPQYFDGVLNPMLILFLPWAFKGKWIEEKRLLFAFALFYLLYAFVLVDMRVRYILPVIPPLVILLVYGLHNIYLRIAHPPLLFAAVMLLLTLNGAYLVRYFREVSPVAYLMGKEDRESYLSRKLPEYPAIRYINQNLPSQVRIYFIFMGRRVYYCERDYFYDGGDNAWILLRMIRSAQNEGDIVAKLSERGLTHLLVREDLLERFLSNNLTAEQWRILGSFTSLHLRGLFHSGVFSVYQIHG